MKIEILQDWGINYSELTFEAPEIFVSECDEGVYKKGNIVLRNLTNTQVDQIFKVLLDNCFNFMINYWMPTVNGPLYEIVILVGTEQVDYKIF